MAALRPSERTVIEAARIAGWRDPFPERIASRIAFSDDCWLSAPIILKRSPSA